MEVDKHHISTGSIMFDVLFIPGGKAVAKAMKMLGDPKHFINEAFKHCKPIVALGEGVDLIIATDVAGVKLAEEGSTVLINNAGVVTSRNPSHLNDFTNAFIDAIVQDTHWGREEKMMIPA